MARAHGDDSLDSTKLHRANVLLFLYVLLFTAMVWHKMLTNTRNYSQVSWKNLRLLATLALFCTVQGACMNVRMLLVCYLLCKYYTTNVSIQ